MNHFIRYVQLINILNNIIIYIIDLLDLKNYIFNTNNIKRITVLHRDLHKYGYNKTL